MAKKYCSECGAETYFDGRNGDPHILLCGCNRVEWIDEGSRGGYYTNPRNARPVDVRPSKKKRRKAKQAKQDAENRKHDFDHSSNSEQDEVARAQARLLH